MSPIDEYSPIEPLKPSGFEGINPAGKENEEEVEGSSFKSILGDLVKEVDELQSDANRSIEGLVTGETQNIHDVSVRVAEAGVAFDLMMEVRNKLLDAYQQISQMQA
jgi:flagellar hook-basal body complex protein FliE